MSELKPCPFCGCDVEIEKREYYNGDKNWRIRGWHSDGCIFRVSFHVPENHNKRNLMRAWNRRKKYEIS